MNKKKEIFSEKPIFDFESYEWFHKIFFKECAIIFSFFLFSDFLSSILDNQTKHGFHKVFNFFTLLSKLTPLSLHCNAVQSLPFSTKKRHTKD